MQAFCAISSGVFGYPYGAAARVAVMTVRQWLEDPSNAAAVCVLESFDYISDDMKMDKVVFVTFPHAVDYMCYHQVLSTYLPGPVAGKKPQIHKEEESGKCYIM